jgi:hypothetical protein
MEGDRETHSKVLFGFGFKDKLIKIDSALSRTLRDKTFIFQADLPIQFIISLCGIKMSWILLKRRITENKRLVLDFNQSGKAD